jgi:hypothetical protein
MSTLLVTTVKTSNGTVDLNLQTGNTNAGDIVIPSSGGLVLASNSTVNAITVDAGANVGIGNTTPSSKLVVQSASGNGITSIVPNNNWGVVSYTTANNASGIWMESGGAGQLALRDANANLATLTTSGGNLTTSGGLSVTGNLAVSSNLSVSGNLSLSTNTFTLGSSSIGSSGYSRMPNGLMMQWGTSGSVNGDSSVSVTFPTAFTNIYCVQITPIQASIQTGSNGLDSVGGVSTSGFTIYHGADSTLSFYWMAIGR